MENVRMGVVGAGIYGDYHLRTYHAMDEVSHLVICDMDEERLNAAKEKYNINGYLTVKEMLEHEDLNAISVATSDPYHYHPIVDSIKGGIKHILAEKPLTIDVDEAYEIEELAKEYDVNIYLDFHKRWDPAYNAIRDKIIANKDTVVRGYMSLDDIIDVPKNWFTWTEKSSPTWFVGTHCIDLIRYITGSEVNRVYASGTKRVLKEQGLDVYDSISALMTMEDGSDWTIENSWILPNSFPKSNDGQLIIVTEEQYFKNESYRGLKTYDQEKENLPNYLFMNFDGDQPSGFGLEPMIDFVYTMKYGKPYRADLKDGLAATVVADAIHRSVETGQVIEL